MSHTDPCPNCGTAGHSIFYESAEVPAHSVLLMRTREEAIGYPTGDIKLAICAHCGFISNTAFDPDLHEYSERYEATQSCSPTFSAFHRKLAENLIKRHDLHNRDILEIGCGQGEFLLLLSELGGNRGFGFDPAYNGPSQAGDSESRVSFIKDFYSEEYADIQADFICCKMTLEHIPDTAEFMGMVRRAVGSNLEAVVFFQVPNATRILRELAFWDIYYEHCSYFSRGSLSYLFRRCGFEVLNIAEEYDDQYLTIEARASDEDPVYEQRDLLKSDLEDAAYFRAALPAWLEWWQGKAREMGEQGQRVVVWGSGSKAVAFLAALGVRDEVGYVVDINPRRQGTFLPGTGHAIVAPDFLRDYQPDAVFVMNPIYCDEIQRDLDQMNLDAELIPVTHDEVLVG